MHVVTCHSSSCEATRIVILIGAKLHAQGQATRPDVEVHRIRACGFQQAPWPCKKCWHRMRASSQHSSRTVRPRASLV
jgi:hypothetical protein